MHRNSSTKQKIALISILMALPLSMGGCPEFRNESINAVETASRGVIDAAVTLFFNQLRSDEVN